MTVGTFLILLVLGTAVLVAFAVNRADRLRNQREIFGREFDRSYLRVGRESLRTRPDLR